MPAAQGGLPICLLGRYSVGYRIHRPRWSYLLIDYLEEQDACEKGLKLHLVL